MIDQSTFACTLPNFFNNGDKMLLLLERMMSASGCVLIIENLIDDYMGKTANTN